MNFLKFTQIPPKPLAFEEDALIISYIILVILMGNLKQIQRLRVYLAGMLSVFSVPSFTSKVQGNEKHPEVS
ncbi:MAG: hypothetical protein AMS15_02645 [Planctomycetes bacterium DG_23]|nr:MAG: hypothetical protein AMS15_02645 [Planctomycetes bacterium DG_23]